ncbi:lysine-2,3-aminomutase-like protein [Roseospira visakhapatnamensis]|uniref:Lysine 2,3-aminomutase n=1 Tax=Roseospira visakhapatnamensis TaxID=390880 RepID=A0A7W6RF10_9PROT|nr:lysine-2,3-aminomutase-like protein [Roseospira visakhapatnamensis]MBB4267341.1 lysine 2,3-aminomutase [Roseospira visakhapatnamensis]
MTSLDDLVAANLIAETDREALRLVEAGLAIRITDTMRARMTPGAAADPIRAQFVPSRRELDVDPVERPDPIGDDAHSPLPGIVHRYPDRVLLKIVGTCAVYCRFCFRRGMVGPAARRTLSHAQVDAALNYIRATPRVREVILSGGDPFLLSRARAAAITSALDGIDHVSVIRWHTRVPVADPGRVSARFVEAVAGTDTTVVVSIHANHAHEFTPEADAALRRLRAAGIVLVSQTVLLAGINDSVETLETLMRAFLDRGIIPYYLHHGDLAPGTGHFRTSIQAGLRLVEGLRGRLSGLAQPTYVLDLPGGGGKVPITWDLLTSGGARTWTGAWHAYPPPPPITPP